MVKVSLFTDFYFLVGFLLRKNRLCGVSLTFHPSLRFGTALPPLLSLHSLKLEIESCILLSDFFYILLWKNFHLIFSEWDFKVVKQIISFVLEKNTEVKYD